MPEPESRPGRRMAPAILAALAKPELLAVFCRVATEPNTVQDAAGDRTLGRKLDRLVAVGLLRELPEGYRVDPEVFARAAAEVRELLAQVRAPAASDDPQLAVLFRDGRLIEIPRNRRLRERLLRWIARTQFEARPYREREVNEILQALADDYVSLRRYLVDEGFFERDPAVGEYRRLLYRGILE